MRNYYEILGVSEDADLTEIKTAFRKLSHKFHPDKNDNDKFFEKKFLDIKEAYDILSNTNLKRKYDENLKANKGNQKKNGHNNFVPVIEVFAVNKKSIVEGEIVNIKWSVINAGKVFISQIGFVGEGVGDKDVKIKNISMNKDIEIKIRAENTFINKFAESSCFLDNKLYIKLEKDIEKKLRQEIKEKEVLQKQKNKHKNKIGISNYSWRRVITGVIVLFLFSLLTIMLIEEKNITTKESVDMLNKDENNIVVQTGKTSNIDSEIASEFDGINWIDGMNGYYLDLRDNSKYQVIKIDEQIWFAENFKYKTRKSKCYTGQNCDRYGRIYPWREAKEFAPEGWRLPSNKDVWTLIQRVGGEKMASVMLTEKGSSGFNALLGTGTSDADFYSTGSIEKNRIAKPIADFWVDDVLSYGPAYHLVLDPNRRLIQYTGEVKSQLFSVRYIKDN